MVFQISMTVAIMSVAGVMLARVFDDPHPRIETRWTILGAVSLVTFFFSIIAAALAIVWG